MEKKNFQFEKLARFSGKGRQSLHTLNWIIRCMLFKYGMLKGPWGEQARNIMYTAMLTLTMGNSLPVSKALIGNVYYW